MFMQKQFLQDHHELNDSMRQLLLLQSINKSLAIDETQNFYGL